MLYVTKLLSRLFLAILLCCGYVAAQRSATQGSEQTQRTGPTTPARPQQNDLRDEVTQLQMQVKDLQAAVDDLKSQLKTIGVAAKENHDLVLDTRITQTQSREQLNGLSRAVDRDERQIAEIGQQLSRITMDVGRVKTKLGLY